MRKIITGFFLAIVVAGFGASDVSAQTESTPLISIQYLADSWEKMTKQIIDVANLMPEEHYDFKAVDILRSFKEQLYHMADHSWAGGYVNIEMKPRELASTKAEVIADLGELFSEFHKGILGLNLSDLSDEVVYSYSEPKMSRLAVILRITEHLAFTRGITIMYLRLKGFAPPPISYGW